MRGGKRLAAVVGLGLAATFWGCAGDDSAQEPVGNEPPPIVPDAPGDAGETAEKPAGQGQAGGQPSAPAAAPAVAEKSQPSAVGAGVMVVNIGALNVRSGPGLSHPVVRTLKKGEKVQTQSCAKGWCQIGDKEFVGRKFLSDAL